VEDTKRGDQVVLELPVSLRDYFAAKAVAALVSNQTWADYLTTDGYGNVGKLRAAKIAYELADAMLTERSK